MKFTCKMNQVGGNSAPESLYRSKLFISSPEQYPIAGCVNSSCTTDAVTPACIKAKTCMNASAGAAGQQAANQDNAFQDMRFGLDHWPLFAVGTGNSPLNSMPSPDLARELVRHLQHRAAGFGDSFISCFQSFTVGALGQPGAVDGLLCCPYSGQS